MNLHGLEFIAGELIAFTLGAIAILWAYREYEPPPDGPDQHDDE